MDIAYDHIQEEILSAKEHSEGGESKTDLNAELQETFRAFSSSPWGTRIGGLWDNVRKQGESYYEGARQEYAAASEEAVKGFSGLRDTLVDRTRGLSLSTATLTGAAGEGEKDDAATPTESSENTGKGKESTNSEGFISRFKAEAARRLKEIEKAEDAADEAILRFGLSISQKFRDAVSIVPPETDETGRILFESKDADGKRVIHATRFEAQLHVIHSNLESFTKDPSSEQWPEFKKEFNAESKTDEIASDLEKYPELRSAMEKLVPEQVEYADFWTRYYFFRLVVETEEKKRKELLKGMFPLRLYLCFRINYVNRTVYSLDANVDEEEEVGWDDDSDSDSPSTPQVRAGSQHLTPKDAQKLEPRRSNDQQSQPDSESSYDVVSGTVSRNPGSPKEKSPDAKGDDSDEDWE
jgi:hypothetical protein